MAKPRWSIAADYILVAAYLDCDTTAASIGRVLSRSESAVKQHARALGILKPSNAGWLKKGCKTGHRFKKGETPHNLGQHTGKSIWTFYRRTREVRDAIKQIREVLQP